MPAFRKNDTDSRYDSGFDAPKNTFRNYPTSRKVKVTDDEPKTVSDRLKTILSSVAGLDDDFISLDSTLRGDLGLDSLDLTEAFMQLEEQLGAALPNDYDFEKLQTFGDLLLLVTNMPVEDEGAGGGVSDAPLGVARGGGAL